MTSRPQFAVVREDPRVELSIVDRWGPEAALVVASGGCTALTLSRARPALRVSAFDFNPAQIAHCRAKAAASTEVLLDPSVSGLNQCGAFEGLFRVLRGVLTEFVIRPDELERFFAGESRLVDRWTEHPYWPTAFQLAFADPLLETMFGPAATQHAAPGSYPGYFQRAFERGLRRPDAAQNRYLHHVLLGRYLTPHPPPYVGLEDQPVDWILGDLMAVPDLSRFGLISLSNIFDWSDDARVRRWAEHLQAHTRPGCVLVMRQLNNQRDLRRFFPDFVFDDALGRAVLALESALFYERIEVARRA